MHLQIVVQGDDGTRRTEILSAASPLTIGRHPQCALRLESDLVSRQHAVIQATAAGIRVEDVSTNGTVAGELLLRRDSVDIPYGTPIVVGDYTVFIYPADPGLVTGRSGGFPAIQTGNTGASPAFNPGETNMLLRTGAFAPTTSIPIANGLHRSFTNPALTNPALRPGAPFARSGAQATSDARADVELRRDLHRLLLEHLDLATMDAKGLDDPSMRPKVLSALRRIVADLADRLPAHLDRDALIGELADEALGLGPLEHFLADPTISEIMVVDPTTIYVEKNGKIILSNARFTDDERVRAVIERIVTPLGRRIDESSPLVDARLKDGSRVNAVIRPIALRGSCITIRKFAKVPLNIDALVANATLTERIARFLTRSVCARKNIVISGGTGSGKTTLLNALSAAIPADERIVTIEDAAELQLKQPHVVSMETRPANLEGRGEYTIRDLVRNALRMRPDRIVVGECRGGEALDMLQAMNTGHDGSLTTTHANSPMEALTRLETLALMAGVDLPARAIREQIASSLDLVVQQNRLSDGSRKIVAVSEVIGIDRATHEVELRPIFEFVRTSSRIKGKVEGEFRETGYLPSFLHQFVVMGLVQPGEPYL